MNKRFLPYLSEEKKLLCIAEQLVYITKNVSSRKNSSVAEEYKDGDRKIFYCVIALAELLDCFYAFRTISTDHFLWWIYSDRVLLNVNGVCSGENSQ